MYRNAILNDISWILTAIGALNWGLRGVAQLDLVQTIFGENTFLTSLVYTLVGLAGVWSIYHLVEKANRPARRSWFDRLTASM